MILEEDSAVSGQQLHFQNALKARANTRAKGEDVEAGDLVMTRSTKLRPDRLGLLASVGVSEVPVYRPLRVAILATGDELAGTDSGTDKINDANRPMLRGLLTQMGYEAVDVGIVADDAVAAVDFSNQKHAHWKQKHHTKKRVSKSSVVVHVCSLPKEGQNYVNIR